MKHFNPRLEENYPRPTHQFNAHALHTDALCCNHYTQPARVWFVLQYFVCTGEFSILTNSMTGWDVWQQSHWDIYTYCIYIPISGPKVYLGDSPLVAPLYIHNTSVLYMLWAMASLTIINALSKYSTSSDTVTGIYRYRVLLFTACMECDCVTTTSWSSSRACAFSSAMHCAV